MKPQDKLQPGLEELAALANKYQLAHHELLAVMAGENIDEVRAETALRERLQKEAQKYVNASVERWPFRPIQWDVSKEAQRFSLDGCNKKDFEEHHPDGFAMGWANTAEIDSLLCAFSHRADHELWAVGSASRLAYLIAYIADGRMVSPPIMKPLEDGTIVITGGHHRYAIAWALRLSRIPICACSQHQARLAAILGIEWTMVNA